MPEPCPCQHCQDARGTPPIGRLMVLCPECGNKRCPKAAHHANRCTRSNEPGQVPVPETKTLGQVAYEGCWAGNPRRPWDNLDESDRYRWERAAVVEQVAAWIEAQYQHWPVAQRAGAQELAEGIRKEFGHE